MENIMVTGAHLRAISMVFATIVPALLIYGHETQIKKYTFNNNGLGTYSFEFETSDGTFRREEGGIVSGNNLVVRGEYGFVDLKGGHHSMQYVADTNGFQPQGSESDTRYNDRRII